MAANFNSDTIIAEKIDFVNRISAVFKKIYKSAEVILTPMREGVIGI